MTIRPPSVGPATAARPATTPLIANAEPRFSGGNSGSTIASGCGVSSAAPKPWIARAAISVPGLSDRPQAIDASVNSAVPTRKTLRGP